MKVDIKISNLTEAQAVALEEFFAVWSYMKDKKMSMWTSFFADSYNDFAPDILFRKEDEVWSPPKRFLEDIGFRVGKVSFETENGDTKPQDMYLLDYLKIDRVMNGKSPLLKGSIKE